MFFFKQKKVCIIIGLFLIVLFRFLLSWFTTFGIDSPLIYTRTAELFNSGIIPPFVIHVPIAQHAFIPGSGIAVLYGLIYWITSNPIYVGMVTCVLQLIGIFILYRLFSDMFSKRTAVIAMFLMLLNPWLCYYSVGLWNPSLIFVFSSLVFYSLYKLQKENKLIYWCALVFGLCMASQVHMSAFLLIVISGIFLIFYKIWPNYKAVLMGFLIFITLFFPYLKYELLNNFSNTKYLLSGATGTSFKIESLVRAIHFSVIFTSTEIAHFAGAGIKRILFFYGYHPFLSVVFVPLSIITAYLSYVIFFSFMRRNFSYSKVKPDPMFFLFMIAFIINPLIYYFTPRPFSPHNLIVIAPILWLPVASFIETPGQLYFPYIKLKHVAYMYLLSSVIAVYMILISHPNQVPIKDVVKIAEFLGREQNVPVALSGVEEVTQLDALEMLHKNYFNRQYPLVVSSGKDARFKFLLLDKRTRPVSGDVVFETDTTVVIRQ